MLDPWGNRVPYVNHADVSGNGQVPQGQEHRSRSTPTSTSGATARTGRACPADGQPEPRRHHSRQRRRILRAGLDVRPVKIEGTFLRSKVARRIVLLFVLSALIPIARARCSRSSQVQSLLSIKVTSRLAQTSEGYAASLYDRLLAVEQRLNEIAARIDLGPPRGDDQPATSTPVQGDWHRRRSRRCLPLFGD